MPEGPEVAVVTDYLQRFVGCWIEEIQWNHEWVDKVVRDTWTSSATGRVKTTHTRLDQLTGRQIIEINCYCKRIFMFLDNGTMLISALGMEGMWTDKPWRPNSLVATLTLDCRDVNSGISPSESQDDRSITRLRTVKLYYQNTRPIGFLGLCSERDYEDYIKEFGFDLLSKTPSREEWAEALKSVQGNALKFIFVKGKGITGSIGNYLRSEIFYDARIDPHRKTSSLDDQELNRLRISALRITRAAYRLGGMTSNSFYSPEKRPGKYRAQVYGRTTDDHGNKIHKVKAGQSLYWVPKVQK
jgi:formamidopyrimidine-DNA glycosylase